MPSMSNMRENLNVWSNGLVCEANEYEASKASILSLKPAPKVQDSLLPVLIEVTCTNEELVVV